MSYCPRCKVSFEENKGRHCFYCSGLLASTHTSFFEKKAKEHLVIKDREKLTHQRKEYLLGAFFRTKTFLSSFAFCVNDMKEGKKRKRFLVQPLNFSYAIKLPWLLVNLVYSVFFHLIHTAYCPTCDMKYVPISGDGKHDTKECEYNQEYRGIVHELFSGKLVVSLRDLEQKAEERVKQGKKSAYFDLLNRNVTKEKTLDVLVIMTSVICYLILLVRMMMPVFAKIYDF
jgi:hypothetical protein